MPPGSAGFASGSTPIDFRDMRHYFVVSVKPCKSRTSRVSCSIK